MQRSQTEPPGKPGMAPSWTSSFKVGVGTAMTGDSNVWFTISHGIVNEVYYPHVDIANIRDMQFIVTDGKEFFSEEKSDAKHAYTMWEDGIPSFTITNTCLKERYRITKTIITDFRRNVLLHKVDFIPLIGKLEDYHLYVLLAPHVCNAGYGNTGWAGDYKGDPMLFAERNGITLAIGSTPPFINLTCGYVGVSDAWQDLSKNKKLTALYGRAEDGNIALAGEIDLKACEGKFMVALGFGSHSDETGLQTRASLIRDFEWNHLGYVTNWRKVQDQFLNLSDVDDEAGKLYRISTAVLKTHEGKHYSGSLIASLSIPWGFSKGDNDLGGYHLIWPRDQVEAARAFIAAGDLESARQVLIFLMSTQEADGHWAQCMWEDGTPYWTGLQLDETGLPILLADLMRRENYLRGLNPWPMVSKAAEFLIRYGPVTQQDRWEENGGHNPFTLAIEIVALLAAADYFEEKGKKEEAEYLRDMADWWNDSIERWLYATGTELAKQYGIEGYYVRIAPVDNGEDAPPKNKQIIIKNRPEGKNLALYTDIVSTDVTSLVRFGIRAPDDPRILNTLKVIDAILKTETANGPVWHRYNEDGYGEQEDGSPYNGTGIGRGWPLLVGERAHYELAAGNFDQALFLCRTMVKFAGVGGLLPEQVWDSTDIPSKRLFNGHASGSAKPLVWAHSEYLTLLRSLRDRKVFNIPPQGVQRYLKDKAHGKYAIWKPNHRLTIIPEGKDLRIQINYPARIHWSKDNWKTVHDDETKPNGLSTYYCDLSVSTLKPGEKVIFTFYWLDDKRWEGKNYEMDIV